MKKYDVIVIGSGKGGRTVAIDFAKAGKEVLLVEKQREMIGGISINEGGIPTKTLVHRAQHAVQQGGIFLEQANQYTAAIQEKDILVASLREKYCKMLEETEHLTICIGTASFAGEQVVRVQGEQDELFQAEKIFINTGAVPVMPEVQGIQESRYVYTSSSILRLKELPKRIVILGAGYLGLEFASIYNNFGSSITLLEQQDDFLQNEDREIAQAVKESLQEREITLMLSSTVKKVEDVRGCALLTIQTPAGEELLYADAVLIAVGRKPNIEGLNLRSVGVELSGTGGIRVNEYLQTTAPGIWALGDVTGGEQFISLTLDDARIIHSQLLGNKKRTRNNRGQLPYCVFTDPAFARVGLTEQEARGRGFSVKVARMSAQESPRSRLLGNHRGLLKAVVDAHTNKLLGVHLFCAMSYETINFAKMAIDAGLPYTELQETIYTHPSMTEAFNHLFDYMEN